jgi:hypothetical protein
MLDLKTSLVCLIATCLLFKLNNADSKLNISKFTIGKNLNLTWQGLESMFSPNRTGGIIEIIDDSETIRNQSQVSTTKLKSTTLTTTTTTATLTNITSASSSTTTVSSEETMRRKLTDLMNKPRNPKEIDTIIKEIIESFNVSNLNKGRQDNQTKSILNRMMTALYVLKMKNNSLNTRKFIDDVILNPNEVLSDGLFEGDIVLTEEQAFNIFEVIVNTTESRKLIRDPKSRWPMPIQFYFDGSHSN